MEESRNTGLMILKEADDSEDAFDLIDIAANKSGQSFDPIAFEVGVFPRAKDSKMYNPINGDVLDSMEKILDFMAETDLRSFSFYTGSVQVTDIGNVSFPSGVLVSIKNGNNSSFFVDLKGFSYGFEHYVYYGNSGNRSKLKLVQSHELTQSDGYSKTIASGTDIKQITTSGFYYGNNIVNMPHNGYFRIIINASSASSRTYIAVDAANEIYLATMNGGAWINWKKMTGTAV